MSGRLVSTFILVGALGCGGSSSNRTDSARLQSTVQELEASSRHEQRKIRDLEYELSRVKHQMRTSQAPGQTSEPRGAPSVPVLPVQVVEPAGDPGDGDTPASEEDFEVVGQDEDGVEIVYVGDATRDVSVRPKTTYLTQPQRQAPARKKSDTQPAQLPADWDTPSERLEVTDDLGPTVDRQLAAARSASAPGSGNPPAVAQTPPAVPTVAPAPKSARKPGKRPTPTSEGDPLAQYKESYDALRAGKHEAAIAGFRAFIEAHPNHDHADNARYWLAEAYYDKREYQVALTEFQRVQRDYPKGNKVPDALLKIGFCHIALGHSADARAVLRALIEQHPKSKPAALAAARLETLGD